MLPLVHTAFLRLGTIGIWGLIILKVDYSVHHMMFSSIHGLYPLDASSTPSFDNKNVSTLSTVL